MIPAGYLESSTAASGVPLTVQDTETLALIQQRLTLGK